MKKLLTLALLVIVLNVQAAPAIFQAHVDAPVGKVYKTLYSELESRRLFVVFEPDLGSVIAGMAERLGDDYNRNGLEAIRSLVVCNAWYANKVSNLDPAMLALCPLRVSLIHKAGTTTVSFARPTVYAQDSKALPVIREIEDMVIEAIKASVSMSSGG